MIVVCEYWNSNGDFLQYLSTVATVVILPICEVESNSHLDVDIDSVVNLLREQNDYYSRQKPSDTTSDGGSAAEEFRGKDEVDNSNYGILTSREIMQLIQQATHEKHKYKKHNQPIHQNHLDENIYHYNKKNQPTNYANEANLERLLSYYKVQKSPHEIDQFKEKQYPHKSIKGLNRNKMRNDILDNLNDYSKVYIILNPLAIQKSKNKDLFSDLIAKVLSSQHRNAHEHKKEYYKGFHVINDLLSRRLISDSRESFGPKDSMEDNYKQKRSRNDHGGSGGSGGGRTAIPYIRQRGDIYERDN